MMAPFEIRNTDNWDPVDEYFSFCMNILGTYFDLTTALRQFRSWAENSRAQTKKENGLSDNELDEAWHIYGQGHPNGQTSLLSFFSTQKAFRERIAEHGRDRIILDQMAIVIIYQEWEDNYREKISKWLGFARKADLKNLVMGEIRNLRTSIIHRGGRLERKVEWLNLSVDDIIVLEFADWEKLIENIQGMCRGIKEMKYGHEEDPKFFFN